jgi:DNA-binding Lrp family transcriptional regulator
MKTPAPTLSPILRSDAQGLLLAALYLDPKQEKTLTELAETASVSLATVQRDIDRLEEAGFVTGRKIGPTRLVKPNVDHPIFKTIQDLVLYAYGPIAVITPLLKKIEGLQKAFIYGSWAARIKGKPGPDPQDIDLMLIMDGSNYAAYELAEKATKIMGRVVNVNNLSPEVFEKAESGFVKTIKSRPKVELQIG